MDHILFCCPLPYLSFSSWTIVFSAIWCWTWSCPSAATWRSMTGVRLYCYVYLKAHNAGLLQTTDNKINLQWTIYLAKISLAELFASLRTTKINIPRTLCSSHNQTGESYTLRKSIDLKTGMFEWKTIAERTETRRNEKKNLAVNSLERLIRRNSLVLGWTFRIVFRPYASRTVIKTNS